MNWKSLIAVIGLGLCASCGKAEETKETQCSDNIDNDGDGLVDCADPDCAGTTACPAQVSQCAKQSDCFGHRTFDDYRNAPMPVCLGKMNCSTPEASIDIHFEVERAGFVNAEVGSVTTRFIKKTAVDGTPVDCARVQGLASSGAAQDAAALDASALFNYQAWDVTPVGPPVGDTTIFNPALSVTTGADFLIFTELWAGKPDSNTGLPTGMRYSYACVESGPMVAEVKASDDWPDATGTATSRTIIVQVTR